MWRRFILIKVITREHGTWEIYGFHVCQKRIEVVLQGGRVMYITEPLPQSKLIEIIDKLNGCVKDGIAICEIYE